MSKNVENTIPKSSRTLGRISELVASVSFRPECPRQFATVGASIFGGTILE